MLGVELLWAAQAELALTVDDLCRRVRADLVPGWAEAVRARAEDIVGETVAV